MSPRSCRSSSAVWPPTAWCACKYRYRSWIGRLILFSYLTPASLLFIPLSVIIARLGLGNTLHGLILIYLTFAAPLSHLAA